MAWERPWGKKLLSHNLTAEGQERGYNLSFCSDVFFFPLNSGVTKTYIHTYITHTYVKQNMKK